MAESHWWDWWTNPWWNTEDSPSWNTDAEVNKQPSEEWSAGCAHTPTPHDTLQESSAKQAKVRRSQKMRKVDYRRDGTLGKYKKKPITTGQEWLEAGSESTCPANDGNEAVTDEVETTWTPWYIES
eukprot:38349-Heterocapsa_arctica.AAC.1